jgi:NADH-quinone oxidoreductase subunit C
VAEVSVLDRLLERFGEIVEETHSYRGDDTAIVNRDALLDVLRFLRDEPGLSFEFLMDVTAVDYLGKDPRFEVVYHLYSFSGNMRVRIKVGVPEGDPFVESATSIWKGANWFEREVWDMYGIRFKDHPDLRRILMYEEFEGHPLRKDYPIDGRQPTVASLEFSDPEKNVRRYIDEWSEGE